MWITLLAMAIAVSLEPFRLGMTILMINRPRPLLQLLAFLAGGYAMGLTVGLVVLFVLRPALGFAHFTLPRVQIVVGAILLVNAVLVATGIVGRRRVEEPEPATDRPPGPVATLTRKVLDGRSLWTAGAAGLGIALPSVDYLAALALIVASGATAATQTAALVLYNVVAFGLVEIPLLCYLVAPDRTRQTLSTVHEWLRARGRREVATLLAVIGVVLIVAGAVGL